jgi:hypothetical protein
MRWPVVALVLAIVLYEQWLFVEGGMYGWFAGSDYTLYMDATRRWLSGGEFYPAAQLAGPYVLAWGAILYPPQMLALFVPFTALPAWIWWAIPTATVCWIVIDYRPGPWAIAGMLTALAIWPLGVMTWWSGTPTIWFVAAMAVATRWGPASAMILAKPTLLPFALFGARSRSWWVLVAGGAASSIVVLGLMAQWIASLVNARGPMASPLYSLENVPLLVIPLLAWAGRRAKPGHA